MSFTFDLPISPSKYHHDAILLSDDNDNDNINNVIDITTIMASQEYKTLLEAISNLETELTKTKHSNSKSEQANTQLQHEKSQLELQLSNLQNRYNETKKSLLEQLDSASSFMASRNQREEGLNNLEREWRMVVDKERKEIEELRMRYLNQFMDVDNVRRQIRSDVRKEYDEQIESLIKEVRYEI